MFKIEYVRSADPVLAILRSNPYQLFGRPYSGYLIFLFGIADQKVASWMREELVALDSLTGPDIAGLVFAKSVGIRGRVGSFYTVHPGHSPLRQDGSIELGDVQ